MPKSATLKVSGDEGPPPPSQTSTFRAVEKKFFCILENILLAALATHKVTSILLHFAPF